MADDQQMNPCDYTVRIVVTGGSQTVEVEREGFGSPERLPDVARAVADAALAALR